MKHDELQEDLAAHLRANTARMVWTNTQLGPAASPRPDVFSMDKSFARFAADAYEIKVTVSDLRRDTTSGKWQSYRKFAHRVWFAFPRGLAPLDLVPLECGVILRSDTGWRAARKPTAQVLETLPRDAWIKLMLVATEEMRFAAPRQASQWHIARTLSKRFGSEVAELFEARKRADRSYEAATERREKAAEEIRCEVDRIQQAARRDAERAQVQLDEAMRALGARLGIEPESVSAASITRALNDLQSVMDSKWQLSSTIERLQRLQGYIKGSAVA